MSRRRRAQEKSGTPPQESPSPTAGEREPPRLVHYFLLAAAFWAFLVLQAVVLIRSLGSGQTVILFSVFLGASFLAACVFDYAWLRSRR